MRDHLKLMDNIDDFIEINFRISLQYETMITKKLC